MIPLFKQYKIIHALDDAAMSNSIVCMFQTLILIFTLSLLWKLYMYFSDLLSMIQLTAPIMSKSNHG